MNKEFNPMRFLSSLGAGGISVAPFAFMQYIYPHPKGLIRYEHLQQIDFTLGQGIVKNALLAIMAVFSLLHVMLSLRLFSDFFRWKKTDAYEVFRRDPLQNSSIMALFLSLIMSMNMFIGPIRFFIRPIAVNLQLFMLPALIVLGILWFFMMKTEMRLLRQSFAVKMETEKMNFGWLIQSFALLMGTVTATGIAAMAKDSTIAHLAFAMAFISGSMGMFIMAVKLPRIFVNHFQADRLPENSSMPSIMILVPILTLFAISGFRIGHYMENQLGYHLDAYFLLIVFGTFALQTWYLVFSLGLMKGFLRNDLLKREYHVAMWGLVCPFVAYAVLGAFVQAVWIKTPLLTVFSLVSLAIAIVLFFVLLTRKSFCLLWIPGNKKYNCQAA